MKFEFKQPSDFGEKDVKIRMWQSKMSGLGIKVKGQLDLWCLFKTSASLCLTFLASINSC